MTSVEPIEDRRACQPVADMEGAKEIIDFYLQPEPRAQHRWILVTKKGGVKIGTCGFHAWDQNNNCCNFFQHLEPLVSTSSRYSKPIYSIIGW